MKAKLIILISLVLAITGKVAAEPPIEEGKSIFMSRCASCHNVNKIMTGPALAGVDQRRSMEWIIKFVQSSQTLVKSGDKDATALFEKFNRVPMPDHSDLTDAQIMGIVEYIKGETRAVDASAAPFKKPGKKMVNYIPLSVTRDYAFFVVYLILVACLVGALAFAVRSNNFRRQLKEQKEIV